MLQTLYSLAMMHFDKSYNILLQGILKMHLLQQIIFHSRANKSAE